MVLHRGHDSAVLRVHPVDDLAERDVVHLPGTECARHYLRRGQVISLSLPGGADRPLTKRAHPALSPIDAMSSNPLPRTSRT